MTTLTKVRASNKQLTAITVPQVAVFVGGTAGIGKAALTELISTGFPVKAYIIGRDEAAFEPTLSELRALNPSATLVFLQGEISLLAEAKRLTDIILIREGCIDLLFLSAGFLPFLGRQESKEGIELSTAVAYYSRQIFIRRLLPLLRAKAQTTQALLGASFRPRIVNVLAAGAEMSTENLFLDDLQLKQNGHFSVPSYAGHVATMTSVSLKRLAEKAENKDIVVMHHHPGLVCTEIFKKSWGDQWDSSKEHAGPPAPDDIERSTPAEAGERSLYLMTSAKYGGVGAPMGEGEAAGLTVRGTRDGALLCVGDKLETLSSVSRVLDSLEASGAAETIWTYTDKVIKGYL
ncbi:uncharacterized protein BDW70DRAFT_166294 [Aspergillus foveolatus]|uniref:uncharacterized protein n=1 Tax=Aspergillus foveolatus TaxID=210207 RepID=UPI003CCCCC07